jgi:photosystem II stability/assembly factor-like uncharacterized protein
MKKIFTFSLIVVLLVILYACSEDSNPITSAGPRVFDPFALWDTASGSLDAMVTCLAVKDTFVFAGTDDSGVFRSSNNGDSWTKVNNGLTNLTILSLFVKDLILFAGTMDSVYYSTNNGANWIEANNGLPTGSVNSFARKDSNLFAGIWSSIYRSADNGLTWVSAGSFSSVVTSITIKGSKLFAGTVHNGIYRSTNNGSNWTQIIDGLTGGLSVNSLAVQDTYLFVATDSGVFRSSNDSSWTEVDDGLYAPLSNASPQSLFIYGPSIIVGFTNYGGVYLSLNNGASWISCNAGLDGLAAANAFVYNGSYLFMGGRNKDGNGAVWRHGL